MYCCSYDRQTYGRFSLAEEIVRSVVDVETRPLNVRSLRAGNQKRINFLNSHFGRQITKDSQRDRTDFTKSFLEFWWYNSNESYAWLNKQIQIE